MIRKAFDATHRDVSIGWLPLFHDMGLVGHVLEPVYADVPTVLMSPTAFLQKPSRWLRAISRYKATVSGGPDFAYDLCVRKIPAEERSTLDLRSWRVAFNGAEPIRSATLQAFSTAFASCGFRNKAFLPCYGMAEATLMISGGPPERSPAIISVNRDDLGRNQVMPMLASTPGVHELVGCGDTSRHFPGTGRRQLPTRRPEPDLSLGRSARSGWRDPTSPRATGNEPRSPRGPSRRILRRARDPSFVLETSVSCTMASLSLQVVSRTS